MKEVEVYDNFLSSYHFNLIESFFMGGHVPWFWKDTVVYDNERGDDYQFNTSIFKEGRKYEPFSLIEPCIPKLGCSALGRIKANCRPKTLFHRRTRYHTDYPDQYHTKLPQGPKARCLYPQIHRRCQKYHLHYNL